MRYCAVPLLIVAAITVTACGPSPKEIATKQMSTVQVLPTEIPTPTFTPTPFRPLISPSSARAVVPLRRLAGRNSEVYVVDIDFSPDGTTLVAAYGRGQIRLWDARSGEELRYITSPDIASVEQVAVSPDGNLLAIGTFWGMVILWDLANDVVHTTLDGHSDVVNSVAFSPDGAMLASGGRDQTIRLWDTDSGELLQTLTELSHDDIDGLAFSPDGTTLAAGTWENTIVLWDVAGNRHLDTLVGHSLQIHDVAFSPDGALLASASSDRAVRLWDVKRGEELYTLVRHSKFVSSIAFSPDGALLASGGHDRIVVLWNVASGKVLARLDAQHWDGVSNLVFSPDGMLIAAANGNDITLWGIPRADELANDKGTYVTMTPTSTPTLIPMHSPTPTLTPTPLVADLNGEFPHAWPLEPFTDEQIEEARSCDAKIGEQTLDRYPETATVDVFPYLHPLKDACDYAMLALAYASHEQIDTGVPMYLSAVYLNPAFALIDDLMIYYSGKQLVVEAPTLTEAPLVAASITLDYSGGWIETHSSLNITQANTSPHVIGSSYEQSEGKRSNEQTVNQALDADLAQALGKALVDLAPVDTEATIDVCDDNTPAWIVQLTYADGTVLVVRNNASDLLVAGGPWQITIDGQAYLQTSAAFFQALRAIYQVLDLPMGSPTSMVCERSGVLIDQVFPER
ncbi:MAG: WD40 repeat domain-containing protein [Anaerolineae bacterium]|nr:WD40 repeat domain-containing protein [Anaerolineae bacterium]